MIYDFPERDSPIKQGDIFFPLPYIVLKDLDNLSIIGPDQKISKSSWYSIKDYESSTSIVEILPVRGIVASQDCDASRIPYLSFFLIDSLEEISGLTLPPLNKHKNWVKIITKQSRLNANWFYLPSFEKIGFEEKKAVNFEEIFLVERNHLVENVSTLREGRLNKIAYQHFREKIAQYYRRYPYDEWYPLNKKEFSKYKSANEKHGETIPPFDWQK